VGRSTRLVPCARVVVVEDDGCDRFYDARL
jgi:hypothetical protein